MKRILVTGGAGFVGSTLALALKRDNADLDVVAFDNLKRRGSELALQRLGDGGVKFLHGDVRSREDIADAGAVDVLVECSAEPSVQAGISHGEQYLINTNLMGTINCLDHARRHGAAVIFLSTSRVYPIAPLRALPLEMAENRYAIPSPARGLGWSAAGISEAFPLGGSRSLYGATKLCSELIITEYVASYGLRAVINRCGVISGPWQMGKVDQGFVVLWAARHLYGGALSYQGFDGQGHQVRDVLHVDDLYSLLRRQIAMLDVCSGKTFNIGGGPRCSVSLAELTAACAARAGKTIAIGQDLNTNAMDIPFYVSDNSAISSAIGWQPDHSLSDTLDDIFGWLVDNRSKLEHILR